MILIVDDQADLGTLLERLLTYIGYEAVAVKSGSEALLRFRDATPSVLVLDLHMPDLDGFDVLRAVRQLSALRDMRVLIYSADSDVAKREEAMKLGATDFLLKNGPHFDRLVDRIVELAGPPAHASVA